MEQQPTWLVVTSQLPHSATDHEQVLDVAEHPTRQGALADFDLKRSDTNVRHGAWRIKVVEAG